MYRRSNTRLRLPQKNCALLLRRLSLYLRSGIPLIGAIDLLATDARNPLELRVLTHIRATVHEGLPLSRAFEAFPRTFRPLHVHIIIVGEMSGSLSNAFLQLAEIFERRGELQRKLIGALAYPAVVFLGACAVSSFLIFYTFPKITPLFRGMHAQLPFTTRSLIWLSSGLQTNVVVIVFGLVVFICSVAAALRIRRLRNILNSFLLRLPFFGVLLTEYYCAAIFRTLGILLRSGIRIDVALLHTKEIIAHASYQEALNHLEHGVLAGLPCLNSMRARPRLFSLAAVQLIAVGEATGTLSENTTLLAELFEQSLETKTKLLSSLVEPVLMVGMGFVVGYIALAIISPMYSLTQNLSTP